MSLAALIRPVVSGILLAGVGAPGASVGHAAPNACALLTLAELSAAVGQPVSGGNPSQTGDGGGQCVYGYGTVNQIAVQLHEFPSAAAARKRLADDLKESQDGDEGSHKTTVETGVGDAAYSTTADMGTMKVALWSAARGARVYTLYTMLQVALSPDRMRGLMLKAVSR